MSQKRKRDPTAHISQNTKNKLPAAFNADAKRKKASSSDNTDVYPPIMEGDEEGEMLLESANDTLSTRDTQQQNPNQQQQQNCSSSLSVETPIISCSSNMNSNNMKNHQNAAGMST